MRKRKIYQSMQTKKPLTGQQAYSRLTTLCARSEHCQHDMLEKMRLWGVPQEEQSAVMDRLVGERYVDDERFTRAFVRDKVRYGKWGRRKIEQALWQKRIDSELASSVLDEVDDDEYLAVLKPLLSQKLKNIRASSHRDMQARLVRFAMSRGFTMDIIRQCVDNADEDEFLD